MGKVRKKLKLHIKIKGDVVRALPVGAVLVCADNTGAKKLRIITVRGSKTRKRQIMSAGIADLIMCSVIAGAPDIKKQVVPAIVIRQRKEFLRIDGTRVKFEDNAAVVVTPDGEMKGTEIKGAVAKEAVQKWSGITGAAKIVV